MELSREMIKGIFGGPDASAAAAQDRLVPVTVRPDVRFVDGRGREKDWLPDVDEVKTWACVVHGQCYVSKHNNVVLSGRSRPLVNDTCDEGDLATGAQTVRLAPGTIIQAGISIVLRNGFRTVTAVVGIVPEPEPDLADDGFGVVGAWPPDVAVKTSESVTHSATIEIDGVVQLSPEDARLISNLREEVKVHGEEHVRRVLDFVSGAGA
ncbi:hypothetical protein LF599_07625 [Pseudodesulfovibrio thermohalotolerans]|uniref:hypothetical protein n=1 Tax=Pseudodesulfovibrio thermohalotolerans TaxID=2880651 RepID=UPI0022B9E528|nr:hypothetical protein [Pseudodesulfovibrio thermohalotolerans]WFS64024.1 hypothetical protein LF599_07625 [Pseudodesulfovibrio thermohalotolerans]